MLASSMLERLGKDLLSERAMMCPSCPVAFRLSRAAVRRDTPLAADALGPAMRMCV